VTAAVTDRLPTTGSTAAGPAGDPTRLRVRALRWEADDVLAVTLDHPGGSPLPPWRPGAHVDLHLDDRSDADAVVRSYSLCGRPGLAEWTVAVRLDPASRGGSRHVHERLRVGQSITVTGPRHLFGLDPAPAYLFVAGGIGITPLLPMIEEVVAAGRPWRLLYAGRSLAAMPFRDRLAGHPDRVQVFPAQEGARLDLTAAVPAALAGLAGEALVYCCGPERMLTDVAALVPPDRLRCERFRPRPVVPNTDAPDATGDFEVELGEGGPVLPVPAATPLLDVLLAAGRDVPWSCREGTCGSCETGVLAGVPEHRDSVLTPAEQAAGDVLFPCVSRALTPRLTLDL
jgi:ferredoxin-NADP reductase